MGKQHPYFRGCWMRPEIFELIEAQTITCKEAILLMVIDSLVNISGKDCYASNGYLGKYIGVEDRQVQRMIAKLKELELVQQTGFTGRRRLLATTWSRIQTRHGCLCRHVTHDVPININKDINNNPEPEAPGRKNPKSHPRWKKFATHLNEAISEVRKVSHSSSLGQWALSFHKLHTRDGVEIPRIRKVLKWYCAHIRKGDVIRSNDDFVPVAYSGNAFRQKFIRIEDAMLRLSKPKNGDKQNGTRFRVKNFDKDGKLISEEVVEE